MPRAAASPTLYLVAPPSVTSWFSFFTVDDDGDEVVVTGESDPVEVEPLLALLEGGSVRTTVVLSSHDSLERDAAVATALRARGHRVVGASPLSASLGVDKFRMKRFFDRRGFASPPWATRDRVARLGDGATEVVIKARRGTQSLGMRIAPLRDAAPDEAQFCEPYLDGTEYSVVVYRDAEHELVFPPIWKGATTRELLPPWRRLRLCPHATTPAETDAELRTSAREIARAMDLSGLLEVEYLLTDSGETCVLEVNPRVAGTMRIAAMASCLPLFSLHRLAASAADVPAVRHAAELPYSGPPISDPSGGIFATSRLTVAADDPGELLDKLARAAPANELLELAALA